MNFKKIIIEQGPDVDGQTPSEYVEFSNDALLKDIKVEIQDLQEDMKDLDDVFAEK